MTSGRKSWRPQTLIGHKLWLFGHVKECCSHRRWSRKANYWAVIASHLAYCSIISTRQKRNEQQIDVSFSCDCAVIDHEFHHNIVNAADYFENVRTKFVVNNRTDALKTDIILLFTNCQNVRSCSLTHRIHVSVRLLTIKTSQWDRENFGSYLKINNGRRVFTSIWMPGTLLPSVVCQRGYTTDSNNVPGIHTEVNARLPLLCSFPFLSCEKYFS